MRNAAIIIGIGGIGSDICARVEQMLPRDVPENRYFRFVIMDTDRNTIYGLQKSGFGGTVIMLTDNVTEATGQDRSISRLAFEHAIQEFKLDELDRVIHEVNGINIYDDNQSINFYVISSLAGGTGSGIALPVALYINRLYMEERQEALFNCKGFFILPGGLHGHGDAHLEDANAYAAINELGAYMREADEHFQHGTSGFSHETERDIMDIADGKVYDFCYMFGMTTESGRTVRPFKDLKDLVANAVYMQACSPMHDINSSLEDNNIKYLSQLASQNKESFLRRFGGIGCGELRYPYQELKEYMAMQWAREVMGKLWRQYDAIYYQKVEGQKGRLGEKADTLDQGAEYISAIDKAGKDSLADEIRSVCNPNGTPLWNQYLEAMRDKITQDIEAGLERERRKGGSLINQCDRAFSAMLNKYNSGKQRTEARNYLYRGLQKLTSIVEARGRREADEYAKSWFVPHAIDGGLEPFQLEFWLRQQGQMMHPNAVRYFLYRLKAEILASQGMEEKTIDKISEVIYQIRYDSDIAYIPMRGNGFYEENHIGYRRAFDNIFEYVKHDIYKNVLVRAYEYADELAKRYEQFYGSYGELLKRFERDCSNIEEILDKSSGICPSYVCADRECRKRLFYEIRHNVDYAQAGRGLSAYIYQLIQTQHMEEKWEKKVYEHFKSYWIDNMAIEFDDIINMDIIDALGKQKYYHEGGTMDINHMKGYIEKFEEKLIDPFLQYAKRKSHHRGISLCCYNVEMMEKDGMHQEIAKWLRERGGVADGHHCSWYQIMLYCSVVGLNAGEIMEYFHIIPHIDKSRHSFLEPDAERAYREEAEIQIEIVPWNSQRN